MFKLSSRLTGASESSSAPSEEQATVTWVMANASEGLPVTFTLQPCIDVNTGDQLTQRKDSDKLASPLPKLAASHAATPAVMTAARSSGKFAHLQCNALTTTVRVPHNSAVQRNLSMNLVCIWTLAQDPFQDLQTANIAAAV